MEKDFDAWNEQKKRINTGTFDDYVHAREAWWCAIGANIGVEADGKHDTFERPVLVLRKFSKDAVLVVCLTSRVKKDNSYHFVVRHGGKDFAAVLSQVRLVSTKRLRRKIYTMDSALVGQIQEAICRLVRE